MNCNASSLFKTTWIEKMSGSQTKLGWGRHTGRLKRLPQLFGSMQTIPLVLFVRHVPHALRPMLDAECCGHVWPAVFYALAPG